MRLRIREFSIIIFDSLRLRGGLFAIDRIFIAAEKTNPAPNPSPVCPRNAIDPSCREDKRNGLARNGKSILSLEAVAKPAFSPKINIINIL